MKKIRERRHGSAVWTVPMRSVSGETYLVGTNGERDNITVMRDILCETNRNVDAFDWVRD